MEKTDKKIKIVIVDDHKMFREGLGYLISKSDHLEQVGEASNGKEFINQIDDITTDVVLMDISMPEMDGIEATKIALQKYPDMKIVALSMFGDQEYYYKMIHAGVKGFILKEAGSEELSRGILEVASGNHFFSQELMRNVITKMEEKNNKETSGVEFSAREIEVLDLICKGLSNSEIADELCLSPRTIEGHRSSLLNKAGVKNSISLVMYALKNKLVDI